MEILSVLPQEGFGRGFGVKGEKEGFGREKGRPVERWCKEVVGRTVPDKRGKLTKVNGSS